MASTVLTLESAKAANISVVENSRYTQTVHDVVVAMRANRRSGTACTKTRGEVRGSNKKLYRQKGTGNARAGERRSATIPRRSPRRTRRLPSRKPSPSASKCRTS